MSKRVLYFEKTLAILQIAIAGFLMHGIYQSIMADAFFMASEYGDITGEQVSPRFHWEFARYHQIYLFVFICFLGGLLWLFNKVVGWMLSFSVWLSTFIFSWIMLIFMHGDNVVTWAVFLVLILLCLLYGIFLRHNTIISKYSISTRHWIGVSCLTVLISADLTWTYLF